MIVNEEEIEDFVISNSPLKGKILEIGSGWGELAIKVAEETDSIVYGIDSSKIMIFEAKAKVKIKGLSEKVIFQVQRAEKLSFQDNIFDLTYTVRTLHETDAMKTLAEIYRVLTSNGRIIIIDWIKGAETGVFEEYFDPEELKSLMSKTGFKNIKINVRNDLMFVLAEK